jgi:hypothetical protein
VAIVPGVVPIRAIHDLTTHIPNGLRSGGHRSSYDLGSVTDYDLGPLAAKARPQHQQLIGIVEGGCAWHRWRQRMIPLNGLLGLVPWHRPQPDQRHQDEARTNSRKEQSNFVHVPPVGMNSLRSHSTVGKVFVDALGGKGWHRTNWGDF